MTQGPPGCQETGTRDSNCEGCNRVLCNRLNLSVLVAETFRPCLMMTFETHGPQIGPKTKFPSGQPLQVEWLCGLHSWKGEKGGGVERHPTRLRLLVSRALHRCPRTGYLSTNWHLGSSAMLRPSQTDSIHICSELVSTSGHLFSGCQCEPEKHTTNCFLCVCKKCCSAGQKSRVEAHPQDSCLWEKREFGMDCFF